jgi:hypothetical protein
MTGIETASRTARTAAVHGDGADPQGLGAGGEFGGVAAGVVPAQSHLDADRQAGGEGRLDQAARQIQVAHQRRAAGRAGDLPRGAAHVDVKEFGARLARQPRAVGDPARIAADELHSHQRQAFAHRRATHHVGPPFGELGAGDHLGRHIGGPEPRRRAAERQVADPGHGGDPGTAAHADVADRNAVAHYLIIP